MLLQLFSFSQTSSYGTITLWKHSKLSSLSPSFKIINGLCLVGMFINYLVSAFIHLNAIKSSWQQRTLCVHEVSGQMVCTGTYCLGVVRTTCFLCRGNLSAILPSWSVFAFAFAPIPPSPSFPTDLSVYMWQVPGSLALELMAERRGFSSHATQFYLGACYQKWKLKPLDIPVMIPFFVYLPQRMAGFTKGGGGG